MASKRSFGTVEKLTSGRWRARYLGPDQTRHSAPVTFLARIDAEGWLVDEDRLIGRGEWTPPAERQIKTSTAHVTVAEWVEQCIRDRASRTHKPIRSGTIDNYRKLSRLAIVPGLGKIRVAVLSESKVTTWYKSLPTATPTQNAEAYSLLRSCLTAAVKAGMIARNPAQVEGAGKPDPKNPGEALSLDELLRYLIAVPIHHRLPLAVSGFCGLRSGEVRGLRRRDIDLQRGMLTVAQAVTRLSVDKVRVWEIGPPKTPASRRTLAIPPHLIEPLRGWLHALPDRGRDQLIFPARDLVTPMADSTLRRSHDHGKAAVGRPALRVHDLRRTAATMAAQGGATVAELMNLLGHETATMAMRYQVASQERDRERVVRLSAAVLERVGGEDLYSI